MCKNHRVQVSKYGNFILENKVSQLLLEGNLAASDKFLSKLGSLKNDIANKLYKAFSDKQFIDKDLNQNWIDITDKDDTVSFIGDRSLNRMKSSKNDVDAFSTNGRNEIKVGRLARAILGELGEKVNDKEIELFVNTYKSSKVDSSKKFILVSGPDIKKYYSDKNYAKISGTLGSSCMKYDSCQRYFGIYNKNPESCQLLVYLDEVGKVLARVLVWKLYKTELYNKSGEKIECPSEYFMDRVYVINDSDIIKFTNYAKEKGWLYKKVMSYDTRENLMFKFNDEIVYGKLFVKLQRCHFGKYPFVDTMSFCNGDNLVSNVGFVTDKDDDDEQFTMNSTDGDKDECDDCNNTGYDDDGTDCRTCDGDGEMNCPDCRGSGRELCRKCEGDGEMKCRKCDGDGSTRCSICNGDSEVNCGECDGKGYENCEVCNGVGNRGKCSCKNGEIKCPDCGGVSGCKECKGEGTIIRKWGSGTRKVICKNCNGAGVHRCGECGELRGSGYAINHLDKQGNGVHWENTGVVTCPDCDGDGMIICKNCLDKNGYNHEPGQIECDECDGDGKIKCDHCNYNGEITCPDCDGDGTTGECPDCDGTGDVTGRLGKCKNPKCKDGQIKCLVCKGTGNRVKTEGKPLCPECAGLLDVLKAEINCGSYKL